MIKTLVIYNVNNEPIEVFEYNDSSHAAKAISVHIIREAQKHVGYGRYERYNGTIDEYFNR